MVRTFGVHAHCSRLWDASALRHDLMVLFLGDAHVTGAEARTP